jgi:hypothetical protein
LLIAARCRLHSDSIKRTLNLIEDSAPLAAKAWRDGS